MVADYEAHPALSSIAARKHGHFAMHQYFSH
jgi:hypothetical protein